MADSISTELYAGDGLSRSSMLDSLNSFNALNSRDSPDTLQSLQALSSCKFLDVQDIEHQHFPFLKLPLELRDAIYELVFESKREGPSRKLPFKGSWIVRNGRSGRKLHTEMIRTCQQIYHEVTSFLYRTRPVEISPIGSHTDTTPLEYIYVFDQIDIAPFTQARQLLVEFDYDGSWKLEPIRYGRGRKGSPGKLLSEYANALVMSQVSAARREIRLRFGTGYRGYKPKVGAETTSYGMRNLWKWVQTAAAVKAMREDIKKRAPAMTNLKITSNVESRIPKMKTNRYNESHIWYRNCETKIEGYLGLDAGGREVVSVTNPIPK
ncbi:hypothetical protein FKW77_007468 [Venturia effusa]|uniref:Uncharacterized protein n=1 Tax=Venturia effusa TaxID=50376 RepID=A0A517LHK4_9PEZI|nr:hypothetical protein FKW77_007468 [Venturia effusa]